MADALRVLAMDAVEAARSGHPGMPMGMAEVGAVLFGRYLRFDPADPAWPDRDRLVLSAGHGSMWLYGALHLSGYARPTLDDVRGFRSLQSPCAGHPENFLLEAVECTTGPLGQGLGMAVGMALAEAQLGATFGEELIGHRTWVVAGDGCLQEGISHEAVALAGHLRLGRLTLIWDDNRVSIDGPTSLSTSDDVGARFAAQGWHVTACDAHEPDDIARALDEALADPRPSLVAARSIIGRGAPTKAGLAAAHGSPLGADEVAATRAALAWTHEPFDVPAPARDAWAETGRRGAAARRAWHERLNQHPRRAELETRLAGAMPAFDWQALRARLAGRAMATRSASEEVLKEVAAAWPALVGGSADLTPSNNTRVPATPVLDRDNFAGRYVHWGIREFGMAAAMNGMALHGGIVPYGGTFLVFSDYMRAGIRLSALQRARVVYVLTHDSIGLGEDGPTHQPVEQLMSLRAIPGLEVFRPADAVETAECWELALAGADRPSALALTRQAVPPLPRQPGGENGSARGAYRLKAAGAPRRVVLVASGSEVAVALEAGALLEAQGTGADVVSMPSWTLASRQPRAWADGLFPRDGLVVAVEAGATLGWERFTGRDGFAIGLDQFGASAPGPELFRHFGFTGEAVARRVRERLMTGAGR